MTENKTFKFLNVSPHDTSIPIPSFDHIEKINEQNEARPQSKGKDERLSKYEGAYDDFCRWYSLPDEMREPKSQTLFEKRYKIPKNYSHTFKKREDFSSRVKRYMWDWIRELFPAFVHKMYTKAIKEGNASAIKFFAELVVNDIQVDKPKQTIQPFMIVGVSQDKINKLFESPSDIQAKDTIPDGEVVA